MIRFTLHSEPKLSAASDQKNENQNTRRHSQQPENDVSNLALLIAKLRHIDFPLSNTVGKMNATSDS